MVRTSSIPPCALHRWSTTWSTSRSHRASAPRGAGCRAAEIAGVYSERFIAVAGLDGATSYTVPAGVVCVLRCIDAYANVTAAARELHVIGSAGQTIWWAAWDTLDQSAKQWQGRQVLHSGEALTITSSDLIDVSASGYLLQLP